MNGADIVMQCLKAEGVSCIFGYPGAAIAPFYDAMYRADTVRHVLVRHEQNAGHAASGYSRASGKVGVCCATSGPGAVNLLTALATAYMDSIPIVAITGQVPTDLLGRDVFQEADITGACEPFIKYSYLVKNVNDIPRIFKEAFYIAAAGRPGPVLIDLPIDIQLEEYKEEFEYPETVDIIGYKPRTQGHPKQIERAVREIEQARRPVICAGGGVVSARARKELLAFAEKLNIPIVSTLMGVGVVPSEHELYAGMLGSHGSQAAKLAESNADLLILCGARVGDRTLAEPGQTAARARIIHIDIDTVEIGKNMSVDIPIVGDVRLVLRELTAKSAKQERGEWIAQINDWKSRSVEPTTGVSRGAVDPCGVMRKLSEAVSGRGKAILVADVGQNQIWAARSFDFSGGRFLTSGGMGTMGYSIPAAMGAKLAKPSRQVIAVCGDGSFQMMLPELATLMQEGIVIKIVVMNNGCLGMVRELQDKRYEGRRYAVNIERTPDTVKLANAYGIEALRVESDDEVEPAIEKMLADRKPYVLECVIDIERNSGD